MLPSSVFSLLFCLLIQKYRTCLSSSHKETHHLFKEAASHTWSWAHNLLWNLEVPALKLEPLLSETIWVVHQNHLNPRLCYWRIPAAAHFQAEEPVHNKPWIRRNLRRDSCQHTLAQCEWRCYCTDMLRVCTDKVSGLGCFKTKYSE